MVVEVVGEKHSGGVFGPRSQLHYCSPVKEPWRTSECVVRWRVTSPVCSGRLRPLRRGQLFWFEPKQISTHSAAAVLYSSAPRGWSPGGSGQAVLWTCSGSGPEGSGYVGLETASTHSVEIFI